MSAALATYGRHPDCVVHDDPPQSVYDDAYQTLATNLEEAGEVSDLIQRLYDTAPALSRLLRRTEAHAMSYNDAAELRALSNYMDGVRKSVEREIEEARKIARWAQEDES